MHTLNAENDRIDSWADTLMSRLGIRLISASAQSTLAEMPIAGNTQPHGLLHGGASAALAETVASHAAFSLWRGRRRRGRRAEHFTYCPRSRRLGSRVRYGSPLG